jgi:hypothetical protein
MAETLTQAPEEVADARPGRLRVAHVTLGLDVGGQEKLLVELARHANRDGFELVFVSLTGRGRLAPDLESQRWPVVTLDQPDGLRPGLILRLARLFRELNVDVVHTHDDKPLLYGAPAARLARVRRVLHTRHGRAIGLSRRQRFLVRLAARLTDAFVCVSEDCAELSRRQGVSARRVLTLRNGIDVSRFSYAGPHKGGPAVTVARLSPEKDRRRWSAPRRWPRRSGRPSAWRSPATGRACWSCRSWSARWAWATASASWARCATCRRSWPGRRCSPSRRCRKGFR